MGIKEKNASKKSKGSSISIVMYLVASVVAMIGVALLVNNILLFKSTVSQAVAQGYDIATVRKALLTSQLLPGMFEPIGIYGGIAFVLFGVGKVNKKVSDSFMLLSKSEIEHDVIEENNVVEKNTIEENVIEKNV
ncbi:MAG: hypothetical protein ACREV6_08285 [Clostridium sp.]|uniref:hypothetical protein n=1 Tax=Clostridium sp. TaxID=1506 RepID=UPI003D6D1A54